LPSNDRSGRSGSGPEEPEQPNPGAPDESNDPTGQDEPLNRAERRARSRGKRPPPAANEPIQPQRHPMVVPRRISRRGNR
jgi:hypothetical protein